jgi:hypothetical protein
MSFNLPGRSVEDRPDAPEVESWTVDQILDYVENTSLPTTLQNIRDHKELADRYGLDLICYEAGQHLVGTQGGENNKTVTALLQEANRHPRMGEIYMQYMDGWKKEGGGVMALFSSIGRWSKWGSWALSEVPHPEPGAYPKYDAVMDWVEKNH